MRSYSVAFNVLLPRTHSDGGRKREEGEAFICAEGHDVAQSCHECSLIFDSSGLHICGSETASHSHEDDGLEIPVRLRELRGDF